ncbi:hypothetical protein ASE16_05060 [Leifsonia sp. Root227]|uniref:DNA glycosylase AlkZ-like family protein n=1 Tax=Leifsonia sp. Root227 TaxID=1736496 RepID=UPI000701AD3C|nr:crosslink repair DNA glycosylase YcaQ family protein [Leifsonia sp. Root227]KRC50408.1 hypothetical protein ASE16_05060 [Leifsonia sp. Root227]
MAVPRLSRADARRIAVRAQRLDADRPTELLPLVEQLTLLQLDPTAAIAPAADLIAWTRIGSSYRPEHLQRAVEVDRTLFEQKAQDDESTPPIAMLRPTSALRLHLDAMSRWPSAGSRVQAWLEANAQFRLDVLALLSAEGPILSRDIPDTAAAPWESTGWTHNQNVTRMLEFLSARGEIATAGRIGRQRTWDIAERVYPSGIAVVPEEEAKGIRDAARLRSQGVSRAAMVGDAGEPVEIEGSSRLWRVDPAALDALGSGRAFTGRTALLSPFDRLIHDRVRTLEVFEFEYLLEMYKPAAKRRWGYFALPILHGDSLVGKLDATADRKAGVLRVAAVHEDTPFTRSTRSAVDAEIADLADWLGLAVERA